MNKLQPGAALQGGKYEIVKVLGQGGFGVTYLARHVLLDSFFAVKEFFPQDYCDREGDTSQVRVATQSNAELVEKLRKRFISEARNILRLSHPGIVAIHDIFEENGTAYYVMDFIEGTPLDTLVEQQGPLPENVAVGYIRQVAEALEYIHGNHITHFDIKPANIMLRQADGRPVMIDFGLSKQYTDEGHARSTLLVGISSGYSPVEQYMQEGIDTFSPPTDIYALGATLYYLLTARTPPEAMRLLNTTIEVPENISPATANAIKWAMQPMKEARCQSAREFIDALGGGTPPPPSQSTQLAAGGGAPPTVIRTNAQAQYEADNPGAGYVPDYGYEEKKKTNWTLIGIIGGVVVLAGIILSVVLSGGNSKPIVVGEDDDDTHVYSSHRSSPYDSADDTVAAVYKDADSAAAEAVYEEVAADHNFSNPSDRSAISSYLTSSDAYDVYADAMTDESMGDNWRSTDFITNAVDGGRVSSRMRASGHINGEDVEFEGMLLKNGRIYGRYRHSNGTKLDVNGFMDSEQNMVIKLGHGSATSFWVLHNQSYADSSNGNAYYNGTWGRKDKDSAITCTFY